MSPGLLVLREMLPPLAIGRRLALYLTGLTAYCVAADVVEWEAGVPFNQWGAEASIISGVVLGFLVGFRNRIAYERWWEARTLWGKLVNDSRNLCLKVRAYAGDDAPGVPALAATVAGFACALRDHLRGGADLHRVPGFERDDARPAHVPNYLAGRVFATLAGWYRDGRLDLATVQLLDEHARALMDICGACERIRNTPLPPSYRALLRHGLLLYLVLIPPYLVDDLGWMAIPIYLVVSYFLLGVELVAATVEEPFGRDGDDLNLDAYCATIRASVEQVLGVDAPGQNRRIATDWVARSHYLG